MADNQSGIDRSVFATNARIKQNVLIVRHLCMKFHKLITD